MAEEIPERVRAFIARHFDSLSALELLFAIRRRPQQIATVESLSQELRTNLDWTRQQLEEFKVKNLVEHIPESNSYKFNATNQDQSDMASELERLYYKQKMDIIGMIYDPMNRIKQFADAFVFRKDNKDG